MNKRQFIKILSDNGVRYDKEIEREETDGYLSDECAEYAEGLYADAYALTAYGIQYGFSKCEGDIREITKLIASLISGTTKKKINLAKTEEKRRQILRSATYMRREVNMDMVVQLSANLSDCIKVAEAICNIRSDYPKLCNKLEESKAILTEIKDALADVADGSSVKAAEYQAAVFEALMDWRQNVSRYNCFSENIDALKGALDKVKEWQKLSATVKKQAKKNEDYYGYDNVNDDIALIIDASGYAERTDGMRDHLTAFRRQTELLYGADSLKAESEKMQAEFLEKRTKINERLAEIKEESERVLNAYQNGELDPVTADLRMTDLEDEQSDLSRDLEEEQEDYGFEAQDLKTRIKEAQTATQVRDKIAKKFESFVDKLEAYRNSDPAMFVTLCGRMDFNKLYDTLAGTLSEGEISAVYVSIETIMRETEADVARQREVLRGYEKIQDKIREKRRAEERIIREQEEERRAKLRASRAEERLGAKGAPANAEEAAKLKLEERLKKLSGDTRPVKTDLPTGSVKIDNSDK